MTIDFESWLRDVGASGVSEPGARPFGAGRLLREVYERRGPISRIELAQEVSQAATHLARAAVELVLRDLHATTDARPIVEVRGDDEYGLIVSYNGGYTTPAFRSLQHPEATAELADYLQGEIVDDLWTVWPICPSHHCGLDARAIDGDAVWSCRAQSHTVAVIGQLSP